MENVVHLRSFCNIMSIVICISCDVGMVKKAVNIVHVKMSLIQDQKHTKRKNKLNATDNVRYYLRC